MTNTELLSERIKNAGLKIASVAAKCGITYQAFRDRITGKQEFRADEMRVISNLLSLSADDIKLIFFN